MENYIKPSCKIIKLNTANTILVGSDPGVSGTEGDKGWTAPDVDNFDESEYGGF